VKKIFLLLSILFCLCGFAEATDFVVHKTSDVEVKSGEHANSKIFVESDDNYHYYKCSDEECTKVFRTYGHTYGEQYHTRSCTCGKCERYFPNQKTLKGQHWKYCTEPNCFKIQSDYHKGGTHDNKGVCESCKVTYQTHGESNGDRGYNETYHWSSCSFAGCTHKSYQEHVKGLIQIEEYRHYYKCTVCQAEFGSERHDSGTDFKSDETYHWQYCKTCFIPLGKNVHTDGDKNKCAVCHKEAVPYDDKQVESFELSKKYHSTSKFQEKFTLTIKNKLPVDSITDKFIWRSSNAEVAVVDENGNVTIQNSLGTAVISARAENGVKAECFIYVGKDISLSSLSGPEEIVVGESAALTPVFRNAGIAIDESEYKVDYSVLEWTVNSSAIKVIDGYITALAPAKEGVKVTVSMEGKGSKSITVKVVCRENEHTLTEWNTNTTKHWQVCSACGKTVNEATHSGGTHENEGVCTMCHKQYEKHGPTGSWKKDNEKQHYKKCYVSSCSERYYEDHTDSNSDGRCDDCGYQASGSNTQQPGGPCVHEGGTHSNYGICIKCGEIYEDHSVGAWIQDGATKHYRECATCGKIDHNVHDYNAVTGKCVCGQTKANSCEHDLGYKSRNSRVHQVYCKKNCGYKEDESHSDPDGDKKCICGKEMTQVDVCEHEGLEWNLVPGHETHWYECTKCGEKWRENPHNLVGDVCTVCRYNVKTGQLGLDVDHRINIYQSEYYIDRILDEATGEYKYEPIIVDMDIKGNVDKITAFSSLYSGYDYLSNGTGINDSTHVFYMEKLEGENKLKVGLTNKGLMSSEYFEDEVTICVSYGGASSTARIRVLKAGEDRARFYANVQYPAKVNYNPNESGELVIRAYTEYLYANSSQEDVETFEKLNKDKLGKFIVKKDDIKVVVNNLSKDEMGNKIIAINETVTVTDCELKKDEKGNEYYDIRLKVQSGHPGDAKVIASITGKYQDKNGIEIKDFEQKREIVASLKVFTPLATSSGGGGSGSGSGYTSGGSTSEPSQSTGTGTSGAGVLFVGLGAVGLLFALFMGWKMMER